MKALPEYHIHTSLHRVRGQAPHLRGWVLRRRGAKRAWRMFRSKQRAIREAKRLLPAGTKVYIHLMTASVDRVMITRGAKR